MKFIVFQHDRINSKKKKKRKKNPSQSASKLCCDLFICKFQKRLFFHLNTIDVFIHSLCQYMYWLIFFNWYIFGFAFAYIFIMVFEQFLIEQYILFLYNIVLNLFFRAYKMLVHCLVSEVARWTEYRFFAYSFTIIETNKFKSVILNAKCYAPWFNTLHDLLLFFICVFESARDQSSK